MHIYIGLDVGAVSVKAAALVNTEMARRIMEQAGAAADLNMLAGVSDPSLTALTIPPVRTRGRPLEAARTALDTLLARLDASQVASIIVTGSGGKLVAEALGAQRCNEFQALARATSLMAPFARTVFEMGGETSKFLRLAPDPGNGALGIVDYSTNGDCAAGTGSFLDQQANRLNYKVQEIGNIVAQAERSAQIAGRCSVFAKSDMIHAQQKGFTPPEVLRGLCRAVALNYKSAVVKGRTPEPPIVFVGGVSANSAVIRELRDAFDLTEEAMTIPAGAESFCAIGAAAIGRTGHPEATRGTDTAAGTKQAGSPNHNGSGQAGASAMPCEYNAQSHLDGLVQATESTNQYAFATSPPLTLDRVTLLRDRAKPYEFPEDGRIIEAYLGIDIGSVGTKLALIDDHGDVIHSIFTRTEGRPIEIVTRILRELEEAVGSRVRIKAVGTTGSGRELIGELVGADGIHDEITCHKTGASFVGDRLLGRRPDTIFEIGGQDSKYISLQRETAGSNGEAGSGESVVVDFTMNEACAAGTGSFLEERAEELGVSIKGEFAQLALSSRAPIRLGERCTVFMERDVNTMMQRGAKREDIIAGLAYSIAYNYINRVVRGRYIGDCIFFQGGTAYNDAVAAAFAAVTGKEIIVPPHNAILGAIGAALLARDKVNASKAKTRFRGYDVQAVDYQLREFTCKSCGNFCSVQEFTVEGEKTFWGDKCSDKYRKRAKSQRQPVIPDLMEIRRQLLAEDDKGDPPGATVTIGIPMAMYSWDLLPLYRRFFRDCGFKVVISAETNRKTVRMGIDSVVAEPCFPIIVAHGHVLDLVERNVDYIWLPNVLSAETKFKHTESHVCPWGQTLPFVIRQAPAFRSWQGRILCPTVRFREGTEQAREPLVETVRQLGVKKSVANRAFDAGAAALARFRTEYQRAGREALEVLDRTGEPGMVLVGRPYNVHDSGVSLSTAKKLRDYYGVNIIPVDALPLADVDVRDINENMYWEYGRKIIAAAKLIAERANLHIIYITNFKCGPDSFVKGFIRPASGKPFLTLQFDGHSNDAGMMTRCEAYLDSKGILRWWRQCGKEATAGASKVGLSTSHKWPTPVPG
ncbi:MAG TPA: acyl-CoA dehydratase activase [Phycisphaerae bacterium]|nr:acyl-CoA dehydratase activase [Phycisphaerae bacterium]HOM53409.1 acyl-CoA dehydratase activase [Phycisphaerae bacterium]